MIEKNIKLVIDEIQKQEKVTDKSKHFLAVCILHKGNYDYFCHYNRTENGEWYESYNIYTSFLLTDRNGNFLDDVKILRYLTSDREIKISWMNQAELISLKRDTIQRQIDDTKNSATDNNLKSITKELSVDCGKIIAFDFNDIPLLLICAVATDEDYYYLAMDKNFVFHYESCVGKYHLVGNKKCVTEMMNWQHLNIQTIRKTIEKHFRDDFEVPFTDYSQLFKDN